MLDLVGVWRLVDFYALSAGDHERTQLLGGTAATGYAVFETSGRVMAMVTAGNRMTGTSVPEMAELWVSMAAYTGKWSIDDQKITTVIDLAWEPSWVGTSQIRYYTFDGKTLTLCTELLELPALLGRKSTVYACWERER